MSSHGVGASTKGGADDPASVIKFGQTKFSDYSKVCVLGKGTYGEVTRCIHITSGIEVAMKTFFFEVRSLSCLKMLNLERIEWNKLFNHEGDFHPEEPQ